ncbi:MAG TPA: hypothetical protein VHZ24_11885 [Pirellulales bacterium]|jgi:hypothetical protein|nr:hypothetical protein [Pirellulales bacterium]
MRHVWYAYGWTMNHMDRLSSREWLIVLLSVVLWGLFCMRGFGSRKDY